MTEMIIRPVPGFRDLLADSDGHVWSANAGRWGSRPPHRLIERPNERGGYLEVVVTGRSQHVTVHSLIALAFLGPRPAGFHVCHRSGNKRDNRPENLMYGTPVENIRQAVEHGTHVHGERVHKAKITEAQASEIRARRLRGELLVSLAVAFGVSVSTISAVATGRTWRHLAAVTA